MTQKCYVCNKYFYDHIDLINHLKESHKTHSFTALIKYFESKLKRDKSFTDKDIDYILSFNLERMLDRIVTLEANYEIAYNDELRDMRSRVINLEMKPEIVCAKDTVQPPASMIEKIQREVNSLKELFFNSTYGGAELPFVPMGPGSDQQIQDRLKWMTHTDKRKGSKKLQTGYGATHHALMEELAPILERRYWELE